MSRPMTLAAAQGVIEAAIRHAEKIGVPMNIAVDDASNDGRVVIFAGGMPVKAEGRVVGAVGISGGRPGQDHEVAKAGAAALAPASNPGR